MPTLVMDPPPPEIQALLERRRRSGADTHDEVWEGVLHVTPAPHDRHADLQAQAIELLGPPGRAAGLRIRGELNIGGPDDFRVPDAALRRQGESGLWNATVALAVEIVSPGDESWEKLPFYAAHRVDELLIVDPDKRSMEWLALTDGRYEPIERSGLIDLGAGELAQRIEWP